MKDRSIPGLIVPIAASPAVLSVPEIPPRGDDRIDHLERHAELANRIAAHGCLVFPDYDVLSEFTEVLKSDSDIWEAWSRPLESTRIRVCDFTPRPKRLEEVKNPQDLKAWAEWAGLASVSHATWETLVPRESHEHRRYKWRFKNPPPPRPFEAVDSARAAADKAESLRSATRLATYSVKPGTPRAHVGEVVFRPLIRYAIHVTIVDPYIGHELLRESSRQDGMPALEWLLGLVDESTRPVLDDSQREVGASVTLCITSDNQAPREAIFRAAEGLARRVFDESLRRRQRAADLDAEIAEIVRFSGEARGGDNGDRLEALRAERAGVARFGGLGTVTLWCRDESERQSMRLIEVAHGVEGNRYGRDRERMTKALTHLKLDKGLSPLRPSGWREQWETTYTAPTLETIGGDTHRGRCRAVQHELELQEDENREPLGVWARPLESALSS